MEGQQDIKEVYALYVTLHLCRNALESFEQFQLDLFQQ